MLSPKFRLLLAVTLALSSLTFLAVTLNAAKTLPTSGRAVIPLKAKLLRSKDKQGAKPESAEIVALRRQVGQDSSERQLEDTVPKHVPIKIKIKADKEKAFKDLNNENWLRDLELEVKNTGTKPIYFLAIVLSLPETRGPSGNLIGWDFLYGRGDLISITAPLKPDDIPIRPGESCFFKLADRRVRGWRDIAKEHNIQPPKRVDVIFQFLNFGDGTGFWGGTAAPLPHPKKKASKEGCDDSNQRGLKDPWPLLAWNAPPPSRWFKDLPAFLPANFLYEETGGWSLYPDPCCPSSSCTTAKQTLGRCQCSDINNPEVNDMLDVEFTSCSDPTGACSSIYWRDHWCNFPNVDGGTFRISCSIPVVFSCLDYAPTPPPGSSPQPPSPTPTPTPEPTCDPATRPNNTNCICDTTPALFGGTPQWSCHCFVTGPGGVPLSGRAANYRQFPGTQGYGGCPPNMYNNGSDCCACQLTTCPDGSTPNRSTCECPSPNPTPTPTPDGGGELYKTGCVDYYWVWFVSHDGGVTWEPTGQIEYAGCFLFY